MALGRLGLFPRALGDDPHRRVFGVLRLGKFRVGGDPAQVQQHRLGFAHLLRDRAVTDGLPRLLLERLHLPGKLIDDVLEPREVLLCRAQPQLRLVPPCVQPRYPGRLLEDAPALLGLGLDDLADAALMHHRGRA